LHQLVRIANLAEQALSVSGASALLRADSAAATALLRPT
jgi:hypothetical protein